MALAECPHCGYQPEGIPDRDAHMRTHRVVTYYEDGQLKRKVK